LVRFSIAESDYFRRTPDRPALPVKTDYILPIPLFTRGIRILSILEPEDISAAEAAVPARRTDGGLELSDASQLGHSRSTQPEHLSRFARRKQIII
jgi:hypothetical protein